MTILLRTEAKENPVPASVEAAVFTKWGYITIQAGEHFIQLAEERKQLARRLREFANLLDTVTVADVVKSITPEEVIMYFENSPVLKVHAEDVRAVLEPMIRAGRGSPLVADVEKLRPFMAELLDQAGRPRYGHTRKAAAILFDDEAANGGANLKRIKAAVEKLSQEFTTTTGRTGQNRAESQGRAA